MICSSLAVLRLQAAQQELQEREPKLHQIVSLAQNVISALQQTGSSASATTGANSSAAGNSEAGASPASPKRMPTSPSIASLPPAMSDEERKKLISEGSLVLSPPPPLRLFSLEWESSLIISLFLLRVNIFSLYSLLQVYCVCEHLRLLRREGIILLIFCHIYSIN